MNKYGKQGKCRKRRQRERTEVDKIEIQKVEHTDESHGPLRRASGWMGQKLNFLIGKSEYFNVLGCMTVTQAPEEAEVGGGVTSNFCKTLGVLL